MTASPLVEVALEGTTCVIRLRREEKLNALSAALERELGAALESEVVKAAPCIVVTGGAKAFSAGADVNELRNVDPAAILAYYRETGDVYERIAALPQPTISAIAGWCLGGGLELALATDFRIADETAVFGLPEVAIGIVPSSGGTHRIVRMVGPAKAKELILLGDRMPADTALSAGLVTEVVPTGRRPRPRARPCGAPRHAAAPCGRARQGDDRPDARDVEGGRDPARAAGLRAARAVGRRTGGCERVRREARAALHRNLEACRELSRRRCRRASRRASRCGTAATWARSGTGRPRRL